MPSTFFGLNIAASGMATYNAGLNTTGHNISNIKTEGYTRQRVLQNATDALSLRTSYGMMGTGVQATDIVSDRNDYYDTKYRQTYSIYQKYSTESYYLRSVEDYFYPKEDKSGSVANSLTNFFTSLSYLTTSPMDVTIRTDITGYAGTLAYYAEQTAIQMQELQSEVNMEIEATVKQINAYAEQISSLTKQINAIEVYDQTANDLRDQRANIIDKLSGLADVTVTEKAPADGNGTNQFIVTLGGGVLVDTTRFNTLNLIAQENKTSQNDIDNLYTIEWSYGQAFDCHNPILGGKLQGLFEIRDGNNADNFRATIKETTSTTITLVTDARSSISAREMAQLDIPVGDGVLTIGKLDYEYSSFTVDIAADGTYTYTFTLKEALSTVGKDRLDEIIDGGDPELTAATVGDSIKFRGIPYYMRMLNEFVRTFSANFNQVQNKGYDLNGDLGKDLFVATGISDGREYDMTEFLKNTHDGFYYLNGFKVFDSSKKKAYEEDGYTFDPIDGEADDRGQYCRLLDSKGDFVEKVYVPNDDKAIFSFKSTPGEDKSASYYAMTALTYDAAKELVGNGALLACSAENIEGTAGWEEAKNLDKMVALGSDNSMFKQGDPHSYLNVLINATLGVDAERIKKSTENSENILHSVDNHRTALTGVDEDEEGQNLVIYQNLLAYQYRVLSIMNEVLDKLINGTAI